MKAKILSTMLLLFSLPLPMYAERYSSPGEAVFVGLLQGLLIMGVIGLVGFFRKRKDKNDKDK